MKRKATYLVAWGVYVIMKAVRNLILITAAVLALILIADMTFLGTANAFIREGRMAYGLTLCSTPLCVVSRLVPVTVIPYSSVTGVIVSVPGFTVIA